MATLGCRFVKADSAQSAEIKLAHGLQDVVRHDPPYPLVGDADVTRHGVDRHLSGKKHDRLLEKQGEPAARPCPWDIDALEAMFRASHSGDTGLDQAVMLEEVEMPPAELSEIMGLTQRTARRARVALTSRGLDLKAKFAWLL